MEIRRAIVGTEPSGLCRNSNTVGRRDWKIGSIPPPPPPPSSSSTTGPLQVFTASSLSAVPHPARSLDRLLHRGLLPICRSSPPLRYKYLPIISRHTGQYHTSVRCGLTTEESHPPRCILVQRESLFISPRTALLRQKNSHSIR